MVDTILSTSVDVDFDIFGESAALAPQLATASISMANANRAPVVSPNLRFDGDEDTVITGSLDATDPDGDALTYSIKFQPFAGLASVDQNGVLTFTPEQDQEISSSPFIVVVDDNRGGIAEVVVQIGINSINDAPVATGGEFSGDEDLPIIGVLYGSDPDRNDRITYSVDTDPVHGTVTLQGGRFTYTPDPEFSGTDSFEYRLTDRAGETDTATMSLTVRPINDGPVIRSIELEGLDNTNSITINEDETISGRVIAFDAEGDPFTLTAQSSFSFQNIDFAADGSFVFTPGENYNGPDGIDFTLRNDDGQTYEESIVITVNRVNDAPVAQDDQFILNEDNAIWSTLFADDPDFGDAISSDEPPEAREAHSFSLLGDASNGTVAVRAEGSFTYSPDADFFGEDSFTYSVTDRAGAVDTGTITLRVDPVNDAPVGENVSFSGEEDTVISGMLSASDVEGDMLSFSLAEDDGPVPGVPAVPSIPGILGIPGIAGSADSAPIPAVVSRPASFEASTENGPSNGSVIVNTSGSFRYTPDADFNGTDRFTYVVTDGNGGIGTGIAEITVAALNDAPTASKAMASGNEDTVVSGLLAADDVDGDPLTYALTENAAHGSVVLNADGSYRYTPDANFYGTDSFRYSVSDDDGGTDVGVVDITVNAVNDAPLSEDASNSGDEDTLISGMLAAADVDGDQLQFGLESEASGGAVTINADGSYDYTPDADFNGTDSFTYRVSDGNGGTDVGTVEITVTATPDDVVLQSGVTGEVYARTLKAVDQDKITGFDAGDRIALSSESDIAFEDLEIDPDTGTVRISNSTFSVDSNLDENSFIVVSGSAGSVELVLVDELLGEGFDLSESEAISEDILLGIQPEEFLEGNGARDFVVTLDNSVGSYSNALGAYSITDEGVISDVQILFADTKTAGSGAVATVGNVAAGTSLEFFVLQNAASTAAGLSDDLTFEFLTGGEPQLLDSGTAIDAEIFHSASEAFNSDGIEHFVSGSIDRGGALRVGVEDLTGGGDRDFQDVVFTVALADDFSLV